MHAIIHVLLYLLLPSAGRRAKPLNGIEFASGSQVALPQTRKSTNALAHVLFASRFAPRSRPSPAHGRISNRVRRMISPTMQESTTENDLVPVYEKGCKSCEDVYSEEQKRIEAEEKKRIDQESRFDLVNESYLYGEFLNDTMRSYLQVKPDMEVRRRLLDAATALSPLMGKAYRATMERIPYNHSMFICAPEQATALRTLAGMVQPRDCLDIGCFTGLSSASVLEALPTDASLTSLEIDRNVARLAEEQLSGRNIDIQCGKAEDALRCFEEQGKKFDFITIDADYAMHETYVNTSIRLLRPGGALVLFGMLFSPEVDGLREMLPRDERIKTAMLPLGCGLQVAVKVDGLSPERPVTDSQSSERKSWQLDAEIAAIDRYLDQLDHPDTLKQEMLTGPLADTQAITYVSIAKQSREAAAQAEAEEAAAQAEAEASQTAV